MTKTIELSGKTCLLTDEIAEDGINIELHNEDGKCYLTYHTGMGTDNYDILRITLPYPGNWRILGSGKADQLGQTELDDIMPKVYFALGQAHTYKNYGEGDIAWTSVESLHSLLSNNGFKKKSTVILVKE